MADAFISGPNRPQPDPTRPLLAHPPPQVFSRAWMRLKKEPFHLEVIQGKLKTDRIMPLLPQSPYVELRNDAYYIAGSRIGLDVLIADFRDGRNADDIFAAYPSIGTLAKVYGAITFVLEHPVEIEEYLELQDTRFSAVQARYPLSPDMLERFKRTSLESEIPRT